ncbi:MAG: hypothetical protein IT457_00090 [Planctomycetes bacterium]|nr:hypothetical protein [Planctomycetota bacterium]
MANLDDARKAALLPSEYGSFLRFIGQSKGYQVESYQYGKCQAKIYTEPGDKGGAKKSEGIKHAIKTVISNGYALRGEVRVYCAMSFEAQNRAFHRDPGWNSICYITLGKEVMAAADRDSISQQSHPGFERETVTCIHEIGHHLHELSAGDVEFWGTGSSLSGRPVNAAELSQYAGTNKKEFVAEAFAAMNIGRKLSAAAMKEYRDYNGPMIGG